MADAGADLPEEIFQEILEDRSEVTDKQHAFQKEGIGVTKNIAVSCNYFESIADMADNTAFPHQNPRDLCNLQTAGADRNLYRRSVLLLNVRID